MKKIWVVHVRCSELVSLLDYDQQHGVISHSLSEPKEMDDSDLPLIQPIVKNIRFCDLLTCYM